MFIAAHFAMPAPPSDEPVYVISVAARLAGLPCWVLRVLDQEGIVTPSRTDSNRRLYSEQDLQVLARVQHLTAQGVNMAGVKIILEMEQGKTPADNALALIPFPQKSLVSASQKGLNE